MSYGFNPYGGYGQPMQYAQAPYMQQMGSVTPQQPQQNAQPPQINVRLVASREEATAALIQFDNSINVFINLAADEMYIKRFDPNTGGAIFRDYRGPAWAAQMAQNAPQAAEKPRTEWATVEMVKALEARVSELGEAMRGGRAGE